MPVELQYQAMELFIKLHNAICLLRIAKYRCCYIDLVGGDLSIWLHSKVKDTSMTLVTYNCQIDTT